MQLVHVLSQLISVQFALEMCLAARNCQKNPLKPPILAFKVILAPLLIYSDLLAENHKFFLLPSHLAPSLEVTPFEFMEKLHGS